MIDKVIKLAILMPVYIMALFAGILMKKIESDNDWYWKYVLLILGFWTIIWGLMIESGF